MNDTRRVKTFIGTMFVAGASAAGYAVSQSHTLHPYLAFTVLALAATTSRMKVKFPGINGNMSVNLPFLLTAVVSLSAPEVVTIALISTIVQCWPQKSAKFKPQQMFFNVSMMVFAASIASLVFSAGRPPFTRSSTPLAISLATLILLLGQTIPVAGIVSLTEKKPVGPMWWNLVQLSFPYYVVSAGITTMIGSVSSHMGWPLALGVFPVMYGIHRSYQLYFRNTAEFVRPVALARAAGAGA